MSGEVVEVVLKGSEFAVVWKTPSVPVTDEDKACSESAAGNSNGAGRGGGRGGRAHQSVLAFAREKFDGSWLATTSLSTGSAGLLLLNRAGVSVNSSITGVYAMLVAPRKLPTGDLDAKASSVWEDLSLAGGLCDDGATLVESVPSGHFGVLALVHLAVSLRGADAMSPLQAVLALEEIDYGVVQLSGRGGSEMRSPLLPRQTSEQSDVLQGTCIALVDIELPSEAIKGKTPGKNPKAQHVKRPVPNKFGKLLAAERALAAQRQPSPDGLVTFRGLQLLAPQEQLKPRVSSAALVDAALKELRALKKLAEPGQTLHVLDLGVGCGALLLAILHSFGDAAVGAGVDIDEAAVEVCQTNALRILGDDRGAAVTVVQADFTQLDSAPVRQRLHADGYDVIVCNPPYRSEAQQEAYMKASGGYGGHTEHEKTLVAGKTGLEMYEGVAACLARSSRASSQSGPPALLRSGGTLIFQVEAGAHGKLGGISERVATASVQAAGAVLAMHGTHVDDAGLERAILLRYRS
eukprot:TRINITY_DN94168_c0_g1_i1.p1 TRINITY_DN94168_c0_g1~~TRINITY_DN94168_c0_g1_i1.p1  ORF type:complete len:521 (+),score=141.66 TRINITY_DN94168_c0_g1_i1:121-1683(+)